MCDVRCAMCCRPVGRNLVGVCPCGNENEAEYRVMRRVVEGGLPENQPLIHVVVDAEGTCAEKYAIRVPRVRRVGQSTSIRMVISTQHVEMKATSVVFWDRVPPARILRIL